MRQDNTSINFSYCQWCFDDVVVGAKRGVFNYAPWRSYETDIALYPPGGTAVCIECYIEMEDSDHCITCGTDMSLWDYTNKDCSITNDHGWNLMIDGYFECGDCDSRRKASQIINLNDLSQEVREALLDHNQQAGRDIIKDPAPSVLAPSGHVLMRVAPMENILAKLEQEEDRDAYLKTFTG